MAEGEGLAPGTDITPQTTEAGTEEGQTTDQGTEGIDAGQSEGSESVGTTDTGSQDGASDDTIFDPQEFDRLTKDLPPELQGQADALRKSLQGDYTKKTQSLSENMKKVEQFDAFMANPQAEITRIAQQLGMTITEPGIQSADTETEVDFSDLNPKDYNELYSAFRAKLIDEVRAEVKGTVAPVTDRFEALEKERIEKTMNAISPDWKQYESKMVSILAKHPTLKDDLKTVYEMAVGPEVLQNRATQQAIQKMKDQAKSSQIGGKSTTKQVQEETPKITNIHDAAKFAKKKLAAEGIFGPSQ